MPGTPDPVLGSDALTLAVACATAVLVASLPSALRDRLQDRIAPRTLAVGGGLAYAALCLGAWGGARFVADAFPDPGGPLALAGWVALGVLVLAAQAAVPLYLYARWGLRSPLVGLFALTALVLYAFLRVRGESDPLALYALFFGPLLLAALCVVALGEVGVRRLSADRSA